MFTCKWTKVHPDTLPCTKTTLDWINDLHMRPKTLKLLEENKTKTFQDTGTDKDFLKRSPLAQ